MKEIIEGAVMGIAVFLMIAVTTAVIYSTGSNSVKREAAQMGVARYVSNPTNGVVRFEWITNSAAK